MYNWYEIFNLSEWLATGFVSRTLTLFLTGIGETTLLITQGNQTAITVDGIFLPLNFEDQNPYQIGDWAIYEDEAGVVWLGKAVA